MRLKVLTPAAVFCTLVLPVLVQAQESQSVLEGQIPAAGSNVEAGSYAQAAPAHAVGYSSGYAAGPAYCPPGYGGHFGHGYGRHPGAHLNYGYPPRAQHPNFGAVNYPKQHAPSVWPYIGPYYPNPQIPPGWKKVALEWDDGYWYLDFKSAKREKYTPR